MFFCFCLLVNVCFIGLILLGGVFVSLCHVSTPKPTLSTGGAGLVKPGILSQSLSREDDGDDPSDNIQSSPDWPESHWSVP